MNTTEIPTFEVQRIENDARDYTVKVNATPTGDRYCGYIAGAKSEYLRRERWVSVKERLPEADKWVLVRTDYHGTVYYHYAECIDGKFVGSEYSIHSATHWMPPPEPPSEP